MHPNQHRDCRSGKRRCACPPQPLGCIAGYLHFVPTGIIRAHPDDVIFRRKKFSMPGRILVIDDEPQITRVLRAALSAQGYDIRTANDPEEGLQVFRDWPPDLVVTDLMMPSMSGVEVTRAIRLLGSIPIVVLS